ncbi:MAG: O-methyltransferase [Spirochaetia bacterium]
MYDRMSVAMKKRMEFLENRDAEDRKAGLPRMQRLRQIPAETGQYISMLAASAPKGKMIEIGTSAGYSTMWLSLAAMERKQKIITFEILPEKITLAKETFEKAEIEDYVDLIEGDALLYLENLDTIAFCFLDAEKDMYEPCWDIVASKIIPGGMLIADNAISHKIDVQSMIDKTLADPRFDALVVPIGKGELFCRRIKS